MFRARSAGGRQRPRQGFLLLLLVLAVGATACSGPSPATTPAASPTANPTVSLSPVATPTRPPSAATARATATVAARRTATATSTVAVARTGTPRPASPTTPARATPARTAPAVTGTGTPLVIRPSGPATRAGLNGQDIAALAASTADSTLLYAGGKGVSKSTDGGKAWSPVLSEREAPRVSAIAIAPSNRQVVFVGVNEGCARGGTRPSFVSIDGGATWRESGRNFLALAVDPGNARLVYAVSCRGVERSADTGASWDTLTGARLDNYDPTLIAIAPSDPQTLYVAYASEGGTVRARRSTDGGTTWQDATPPGDLVGPLALAVDAADAKIVFLSTTTGLYRSGNSGRSWELLTKGLEATTTDAPAGAPAGTRTNSAILADPVEGGTLWLGTGTGSGTGSGIYRTVDGGTGWKSLTDFGRRPVRALALSGPLPSQVLYIATDDGVWALPAAAP